MSLLYTIDGKKNGNQLITRYFGDNNVRLLVQCSNSFSRFRCCRLSAMKYKRLLVIESSFTKHLLWPNQMEWNESTIMMCASASEAIRPSCRRWKSMTAVLMDIHWLRTYNWLNANWNGNASVSECGRGRFCRRFRWRFWSNENIINVFDE